MPEDDEESTEDEEEEVRPFLEREKVLYRQPTGLNPLNHRDDSSGPALHHGCLDFLESVVWIGKSARLVHEKCRGSVFPPYVFKCDGLTWPLTQS